MASQTIIQSSIWYSLIFADNGKLNYQRPFFDTLVCFLLHHIKNWSYQKANQKLSIEVEQTVHWPGVCRCQILMQLSCNAYFHWLSRASNLQLTGLKECYIPTPNVLVCKQYGWPRYLRLWIWCWRLGDKVLYCIRKFHGINWIFDGRKSRLLSILMQYWAYKCILSYPWV